MRCPKKKFEEAGTEPNAALGRIISRANRHDKSNGSLTDVIHTAAPKGTNLEAELLPGSFTGVLVALHAEGCAGVLPRAPGNKRFLLAATNYFTKWVEAELLAQIRETDVIRFIRGNILSKFSIPQAFVSDNGTQFVRSKVRGLLEQLKIEFYNSTPSYPQCNSQAEATNKTIMNRIKKRLEKAKGRWVDELANVLWAYRTTPQKETNETPYSLAFGFKAVIPLEVSLPTIWIEAYNTSHNNEVLARDLDLAEERRENALIRMADYQKQLAKSFNQKVQQREFEVGSLVLRKVVGNTKDPTDSKLGPNWRGPTK
ncbi:hypothetical protein Acr_28g0004900 [Actinidia rufa]|uniref:Integrase catalytic domain-containing protein n=1 Tax=Actinidia rufa TaxID=165716 RepID=A0A7J0H9Y9_9ERIC|nr:hypothetical protein Acr_28g0004900 [Actinidia rufa]